MDDRAVHARPPAPLTGVPDRSVSGLQALLKPIQHFVLNPSHPARAKLYPLWELAGLLQARDVLRRIQDQLLDLALRQNPHHDVSLKESIAMPRLTTIPEEG
jgi:hypothetical protein